MPVDKFRRMSTANTRDTGVLLTYINNNYVRSDGGTPVSGSIDMRSNTLYNVSNPVNPQDVATKEYADNVRGGGWVKRKQDGTYAIKRDLNMNGKKLKNIPPPVEDIKYMWIPCLMKRGDTLIRLRLSQINNMSTPLPTISI